MKILLLGSLRCIGQGWTFGNIEEAACTSRKSHRYFFNVLVEHGSTVLCKTYVTLPAVNADPFEFEKPFVITGLNGFLGSTDANHVRMLSCSAWAKINHLKPKLKTPSL